MQRKRIVPQLGYQEEDYQLQIKYGCASLEEKTLIVKVPGINIGYKFSVDNWN